MEWAPNFRTESLLLLDSCRPRVAQSHTSDWARIVSPLMLSVWERGLSSHHDCDFVQYVCEGICNGFQIGFDYCKAHCRQGPGNMGSAKKREQVVEQYIGVECEARRLIGPLDRTKFPQVHISPFGVIPKSEPGKWHLILDLSSPNSHSINDGVDKRVSSLSYVSIDDIADRVMLKGRGTLMAKFDLKEAYRQVSVHRWMLGMEWNGQLFVDTALPFGLRSAPLIFNAVAEALAYMIKGRGVEGLDHYLDDFSIVGDPKSPQCGHFTSQFPWRLVRSQDSQ